MILNINTLNEKSNEDGYIIDNVIFYKNNKEYIVNKIIICFATNNLSKKEYSALIGYNTYINNLKGVSFC